MDSNLRRKKERKRKRNHNVNKSSQSWTEPTYILILVFAEVIYGVNSLFLEIRKRPEKLDNVDSG
jgi:hypothetical protein